MQLPVCAKNMREENKIGQRDAAPTRCIPRMMPLGTGFPRPDLGSFPYQIPHELLDILER